MDRYTYQATNAKGDLIKGEIEAPDEQKVIYYLKKERLIPIKINKASKISFSIKKKSKIKYKTISIFTLEMATLLEAGMPLDRSLYILSQMEENPEWKMVLDSLLDSVKSGRSLAESMRSYSDIFSKFYIGLVAAGELSGSLNVVLERLSEHMEKTLEVRSSLIKVLSYPMMLMVIGFVALIYLFLKVVPQFEPMIASSQGSLPLLSDIIFFASRVLRQYWYILAITFVFLFFYVRTWFTSTKNREKLDKRLIKNRITRDLIKNLEISKLSRTLGTMLTHGVPLPLALQSTRESITNSVVREVVDKALNSLKSGQGMSKVLIESRQLPTLGVQMIRVGEETGKLEKMLLKVANIYDKEVKASIERVLGIIQPIMVIFIAGMIGLVMAGLVMAISSLKP